MHSYHWRVRDKHYHHHSVSYTFTMCWMFYFLWYSHQVEGTYSSWFLLRKTQAKWSERIAQVSNFNIRPKQCFSNSLSCCWLTFLHRFPSCSKLPQFLCYCNCFCLLGFRFPCGDHSKACHVTLLFFFSEAVSYPSPFPLFSLLPDVMLICPPQPTALCL